MHGRGQPGAHESRKRPSRSSGLALSAGAASAAGTSGPTGQDEVAALADEDATVVQHHAGVEEGKVAEEVPDLALSTGVGPVDHL